MEPALLVARTPRRHRYWGGCWPFGPDSGFGECLVPERTFGRGPQAAKTLWWARVVLFLLYCFLALVLAVCAVCFLMGRIEIVDHRMKYSRLEAPSIAVCPWNAGSTIMRHPNASYSIHAIKIELDGTKRLPHKPRMCLFDRVCECLDLHNVTLNDVEDSHHGPTGLESHEEQNFREGIEIRTTLMDPSEHKTLKFGFYDSQDHRPSWFYSPQWFFLIGQLRLDSWMVSEENQDNIHAILTFDPSELDRRHFYNFDFSSTIGTANQRFTRLHYEFRTFFVMETISSERTVSLFTFVLFILLVVGVSQVLIIWELLFPVYVDGQVQKRTVSAPLHWILQNVLWVDIVHAHDCEESSDASTRSGSPRGVRSPTLKSPKSPRGSPDYGAVSS